MVKKMKPVTKLKIVNLMQNIVFFAPIFLLLAMTLLVGSIPFWIDCIKIDFVSENITTINQFSNILFGFLLAFTFPKIIERRHNRRTAILAMRDEYYTPVHTELCEKISKNNAPNVPSYFEDFSMARAISNIATIEKILNSSDKFRFPKLLIASFESMMDCRINYVKLRDEVMEKMHKDIYPHIDSSILQSAHRSFQNAFNVSAQLFYSIKQESADFSMQRIADLFYAQISTEESAATCEDITEKDKKIIDSIEALRHSDEYIRYIKGEEALINAVKEIAALLECILEGIVRKYERVKGLY